MDLHPTSISRDGNSAIQIVWSDGRATRWTATALRDACPCATCREKNKKSDEPAAPTLGLPVLSAAEAQPLSIASMRPVGNYAYNIGFSDGHSSGLFTLEMLYENGGQ